MLVFDRLAWSVAIALFAGALWFSRSKPRVWTFSGLLARLRGASAGASVDVLDWLGAGVSWEQLQEWCQGGEAGEGLKKLLGRKLGEVTGLWLGEPAFEVDFLKTVQFSPGELTAEREHALVGMLGDARVVAFAHAESQGMLELLRGAPGLRDRLVAVVVLGELSEEWVKKEFTHENFDLERMQVIPYFWASQHAPETPLLPKNGRASIEVIPLDASPRELALLMAGLT